MAFLIRLKGLGSQSLWLDEVMTVQDAMHPFVQIHRQILASPPIFHYVVRLFYLFFGKDDFWLRFPAAVFGTLTIPIFYMGLKHFAGLRTAVWGALLLALSPIHIAYSQELRMYSLGALEVLAAIFYFERALESNAARHWAGVVAANLLGLYTHNWILFFTLSQVIGYALIGIQKRSRRPIGWLAFLMIGLFYLPWIPWLHAQAQRPVFSHLFRPSFSDFRDTFSALLSLNLSVGDCTLLTVPWVRVAYSTLGLVGMTAGLWVPGRGRDVLNRMFLLGCVLPLLMAFVTSLFIKPIYMPSRYPVMALPCFLIPLVRCVAMNDNRILRRLGCAMGLMWIIGWSMTLGLYYGQFAKGGWKFAAHWIAIHAYAGDGIWPAPLGFSDIALRYYLPGEIVPLTDPLSGRSKHLFIPYFNLGDSESSMPLGPRMSRKWSIADKYRWGGISVLLLNSKAVASNQGSLGPARTRARGVRGPAIGR